MPCGTAFRLYPPLLGSHGKKNLSAANTLAYSAPPSLTKAKSFIKSALERRRQTPGHRDEGGNGSSQIRAGAMAKKNFFSSSLMLQRGRHDIQLNDTRHNH